jgi:splicing factor 3B subunit 3
MLYVIIFIISGAIEKQKLVYILNRDAEARLTISSPLEAHKSNTLVYHTVGVDVGFENPMFACLEIDYEVKTCMILHY